MNHTTLLRQKQQKRIQRVRAKILGSSDRPRLAIFRSNRGIYVQLIDDRAGMTLVSASVRELGNEGKGKTKVEAAFLVGELVAKRAKERGIAHAVLDRRSYAYHGRVSALAEGVRKGGLKL